MITELKIHAFSEIDKSTRSKTLENIINLYKSEFGDYNDPTNTVAEDPIIWINKNYSTTNPLIEVFVALYNNYLAGFIVAEYYKYSQSGLLSYIVVHERLRRKRIASLLVEKAILWLKSFSEETVIFVEFENPSNSNSDNERMVRCDRIAILKCLGVRSLPLNYIQPRLSKEKQRSKELALGVLSDRNQNELTVQGDRIKRFLTEFYSCCEDTDTETLKNDPEFSSILESAGGWILSNKDLILKSPQPLMEVSEASFAYEFALEGIENIDRIRPYKKDDIFHSYGKDLLSYAYCEEPPIETFKIFFTKDHNLINVILPHCIKYEIEGLDYALTLPPTCLQAKLQLHASFFRRSKRLILHCVITPQLRNIGNISSLSEYDILRLTSLWSGLGAIETVNYGLPLFQAKNDQIEYKATSVLELYKQLLVNESNHSEFFKILKSSNVRAAGGILQLVIQNENEHNNDFTRFHSTLHRLIKNQQEENIPDKNLITPENIEYLKRLAGFAVNIFDFENVDDNELADTLQNSHIDQSKIIIIHRGTTIYISKSDRNLTEYKDDIGISPYLIIPQSILVHNEMLLRDAYKILQKISDTEYSSEQNKIKEKEKKYSYVSKLLNQHYIQSIFQYPTERWIYNQGSILRGLSDLMRDVQAMQTSLKVELDQHYEARENTWNRIFVIIGIFFSALQVKDTISQYIGRIIPEYQVYTVELITMLFIVSIPLAIVRTKQRQKNENISSTQKI